MTTDDLAATAITESIPLGRNRDFNLLWMGQAASALGSEISEIAYPLLILATTGSAAEAGLVGAAVLIAHLLTLLPAGVVADRYPRKRIMVASSLVQLVAVSTVVPAVFTGHVWILQLVAVGAIQGVASAFYVGANRGAIRRIVPMSQLTQALSRTQARDQAANLAGPPLGGILFGVAQFLPFICDAVSFSAIGLAAAMVRGPMDADVDPARVRVPLRRSVTKGMRYVMGSPYLRTVALWAASVNFVGMGMVLMLIVLARYRGGGPTVIGLVAATGPVGGFIGAFVGPRLIKLLPGRRMVITASWVMTLCPIGMAIAPSPGLIGLTAALAMFATMPVNVILLTRATELTSHDMQAQTGNALLLVGSSLKWLAPLAFGLMSDGLGPVGATLIGGSLYVCTAVWLQFQPALHQLDHPVVAP